MGPEDMKLADMEKAIYAVDPNKVGIMKEWIMDPPPFILRRLPDDIVFGMYRVKLEHLAKISDLAGEINRVESNMYNEVAGMMNKMG